MSLQGSADGNYVLRGKLNRLYELRGYSAYEVALINGFEGTEEEWIESLSENGYAKGVEKNLNAHAANKSNPHGVTIAQIGAAPASHTTDKSNPHGVTAEQAGAASLTGSNTFAKPIAIDANGNSALDLKWTEKQAYMAQFALGYHTAWLNAFNDKANLKTYRALGVHDNYYKNLVNALTLQDVVDNVTTEYAILHTGNKPTGSYTGNGSSAVRRISTGGIGNLILVTSAEYGSVLVMPNGGIHLNAADIKGYSRGYFRVEANCTLVTASDLVAINANGVTYTYQVL